MGQEATVSQSALARAEASSQVRRVLERGEAGPERVQMEGNT